jgi:uncharacterized protein YggE
MSRITTSVIASTVLLSGVTLLGSAVIGGIAPAKLLAQQIVYPSTSDPNGVMVTGQGVASVPADVAEIRFAASAVDPEAADEALQEQLENSSGKPLSPRSSARIIRSEITEASLKPIVAAIVATGIPASAVQVSMDGANASSPYRRSPRNSAGTIRVTLEKPSRSSVQKVVDAGDAAAKTAKLFAQVYLKYRVNDCPALEKAAYRAAVNDAQRRAQAIAAATGVQLAAQPSIAEAFYSTFYPSPCNPSNKSFYPTGDSLYTEGFAPYNANTEATVETRKDIFVTYKLK